MSDLDLRFRRAYWAAVHYVDTRRMYAWEERGLTLPQLRILFQLRAQPGITTNIIARKLGLTVPTVSGLVDKLARAGLVERGQRLDDRRVIPLSLTEDGKSTVGEIREGNRAHLATLSEQLGADLEPVTVALERLARQIDRLQSVAAEEESLSAV